MQPASQKQQTVELVRLYRRHEDWARRSGYFAMDWLDFKSSRLANPLSRAALNRANTGDQQ